jgi:hypothetical protein
VVPSSCTTFLGSSTPVIKLPRHLVGLFTCDMLVDPWDTTNRSNLPFHSSICNILTGIHLSSCVDGLDLGRVLLHPNPVFLSIESQMGEPAQSWCYSIESWEIFKWFEYFYS